MNEWMNHKQQYHVVPLTLGWVRAGLAFWLTGNGHGSLRVINALLYYLYWGGGGHRGADQTILCSQLLIILGTLIIYLKKSLHYCCHVAKWLNEISLGKNKCKGDSPRRGQVELGRYETAKWNYQRSLKHMHNTDMILTRPSKIFCLVERKWN